jgi:uncharacterized membrane protein
MQLFARDVRLSVPALLVGIGFGGLFDGIVFHQVLQWHHMLSDVDSTTTVAGLEANTLADGLFHVASLATLLFGIVLFLRRDTEATPTMLLGSGIVGWGSFNFVEGVVDHLVLGVHHVREVPHPLSWDLAFLVASLVLIALGLVISTAPARALAPKK